MTLRAWSAIAALALLAGVGCDSRRARSNSGEAHVAVQTLSLTAASAIAEVVVTVKPGSGSSFTPFTTRLQSNGTGWSGYIQGIPAGAGRLIEVSANAASHKPLYLGSATVDIVVGRVAAVVITLSAAPSDPYQNAVPVVDAIGISQTTVEPLGQVNIHVSAHDPDPQDTILDYLWSGTCGTFDAPTRPVITWTAPAVLGPCQLSLRVSDRRGASAVIYLVITVVAASSGDVQVDVFLSANSSPIITAMTVAVRYKSPIEGDVSVSAVDPDGDPLAYAWSSDCPGVTYAAPTSAATTFTSSDGTRSCVLTVRVTDGKGGSVLGASTVAPDTVVGVTNLAPLILHAVQPVVDPNDPLRAEPVAPDEAVPLWIYARDPEGQALAFAWTATAGTLDGQVDVTTSPGNSTVVLHVPTAVPTQFTVTATVSDPLLNSNAWVFHFKPSQSIPFCNGKADGTPCDDGNPCTLTDSCQAGQCLGANPVQCPAPTAQCKAAGVCQVSGPAAGICTYADQTGTTCDDGKACTVDLCGNGVCVGTPNCPAGQACDAAGVCQCSPSCTGKACGDDGCGGSCGTCAGGAPCSTSGQCACVPACAGKVCGPDGCGGTCGTCTGGTSCDVAGQCQLVCTPNCTGKVCGDDGCGGTCGTCTTGTCSTAGQCSSVTVPRFTLASQVPVGQFNGIATDASGAAVGGGQAACGFTTVGGGCAGLSFGSLVLTPKGANDAFVVKYGPPPTSSPQWVVPLYGQNETSSPSAQGVSGVAITDAGTVAVTGSTDGGLLSLNGAINLPNLGGQTFLAYLNGATGAGLRAFQFDLGTGTISAIAAKGTRVALCGSADRGTIFAASGFVFDAASAPNRDVILAVFDATATGFTPVWSKQLGAGADEYCAGLAFDDAGNLVAVGQYNWVSGAGLLDLGDGPLPNPNGAATSSNSFRQHLWVARFDATGLLTARATFGNVGASGAVTPGAVAVDSAGNLLVGGMFTGTLPLGTAGSLTSAGNTDGFVVLLAPVGSGFTPTWASRIGASGVTADGVSSVAFASSGDAVAAGTFFGPTTGAATLPYVAGNGADAFLLKFSAAGKVDSAIPLGGAGAQGVSQVLVNRTGIGAARDQLVMVGHYEQTITFSPLAALPVTTSGASYVVFGALAP